MNIYSELVNFLLSLSRIQKTLLLTIVDYFLLVICFELSLSLRINDIFYPNSESLLVILVSPIIGIIIFHFCGLYQSFVRFTSYHSIKITVVGISLYTAAWFIFVLILGNIIKPYDFLIINWMMTIFAIGGVRFLARNLLTRSSIDFRNIMIYGAGYAGTQLQSAIQHDNSSNLIGFIDDDPIKQGLYIGGVRVFSSDELDRVITEKKVQEILIAIPSLSRFLLQKLIRSLKHYPVVLRVLPDILDLVKGNISVSDLKKINIEDLLKREIREPNTELLTKDIKNKNILVTGAGGSIGSEICRQVLEQNPKILVLFEISEIGLYKIEKELSVIKADTTIVSILGNVTNQKRLEKVMLKYSVETVFHTAAYKHVPIVEKNIVAGLRCNIFGTLSCVMASAETNVESFVFISTDKAVRPTNIMGATKRFAELVLQSYAKRPNKINIKSRLRISMVRFGNVLGSSGSVVPLFRDQIERGGPVTVTDPNIIRYFMTIPEAAQLVIQAGAMGQAGEIFVLDMGEPVHVLDLARDMIRLSGMTIRDDDNPDGDIEIVFTGLREGEKLYEELLVDGSVKQTLHEKIMQANDPSLEWEKIYDYLLRLEKHIIDEDLDSINEVFNDTVAGFKRT